MVINPSKIKIEEYSYNLPGEKIAKYPLEKRDSSSLLVYEKGNIEKNTFGNIVQYLKSDNLLVFNNTKVIQARLKFYKPTGAQVEIFCLEPVNPSDYVLAFQQNKKVCWKCIVGNLKKWKTKELEKEIKVNDSFVTLKATKTENFNDSQIIEFSWNNPHITFSEILEKIGNTPIPPYLNRESENIDKDRYQTVYSKSKGSVAAPTAGLHFTSRVFDKLKENKVTTDEVTLHVGAGTFKPVKSETIDEHEMHTEHFMVHKKTIQNLINNTKITAVGTTSVRTLESIYWMGVKLLNSEKFAPTITQWEAYSLPQEITKEKALNELLSYMKKENIETLNASTQIMIFPGYSFKIIKSLITNFHQPCSTLLLLIAAFIGDDWKKVYDYALKNNFRFLSYGDSSILIP